jgi:hypothetical protein
VRLIFESDRKEDFFELILTEDEIEDLSLGKGIHVDFPEGLYGCSNLNIYIRPEILKYED